MSIRKAITGVIILIILMAGAWAFSVLAAKQRTGEQSASNTVTYACDAGKTIVATYIEGTPAPQAQPGEPPVPTGSVEVSIGGAPATTLAQTLSADGVRYANADESLVFWEKGDTALVMRDNSMDMDYTNCTAASADADASQAPAPGPISVSGTFVCLPHKDTSGPQTDECAFGIKDDSGRYFALSSSNPALIGTLAGGARITVSGTFATRAGSKYQDLGVITVTSVEAQ